MDGTHLKSVSVLSESALSFAVTFLSSAVSVAYALSVSVTDIYSDALVLGLLYSRYIIHIFLFFFCCLRIFLRV